MKKWIILCLLFGMHYTAVSQNKLFAFATKETGNTARETVTDHKFRIAQLVFDSLVAGQGDLRLQEPSLVMRSSERYVAWARPEKAEIGLEELAYDICTSFGADSLNALAALLTHELVHYYEKHDWSRHFVKENKDLPAAQQMEKLQEGLKLEAQADYLGGFLAYSVGFDVYGIMPELLKKIYAGDGYDLPAELDGYPSLQDRISMSESSMERLKELQLIFDMGNYLTLLEKHTAADKYYHYILRDFQSRDIYNNAGVNMLLEALTLFTPKEMPYALAVELDPVSRLSGAATRNVAPEAKKQRSAAIGAALEYFDRAFILDKRYAPAFINKAAAYILLEEWEEAQYWLRKASKEDLNEKMAADVQVLKGVIAAMQQDTAGAEEWWNKALQADSYPAEVNLKIQRSGSEQLALEAADGKIGFALRKKEEIEALPLDQFLEDTPPDRMIQLDERTVCGFYQRPGSKILSHVLDGGKEFFSVQVVDHTFSGKSMEGIQVGDSRKKLLDLYGAPQRQVQAPSGEFLVYEDGRNIFFQLDGNAKITGWGVYRINER